MAADYFLKIETIEGESKDHKHAGEIEIDSFSFGESQTGSSAHGTGMGSGKVSMNDFHFTMTMNKATPKLFLACATGEHIAKCTLVCRKAGGGQEEYLKVDFSDVLISSYQVGGHGGQSGLPQDQCSFNFTKIEIEYKQQDEKGQVGKPVKVGYDLKLNKKV